MDKKKFTFIYRLSLLRYFYLKGNKVAVASIFKISKKPTVKTILKYQTNKSYSFLMKTVQNAVGKNMEN